MKTWVLAAAATLLSGTTIAAETYIRNGNVYSHEGKWNAEAGVATTSDLFKGQKHSVVPLLNFGYHGDDFNADLNEINYRFIGSNSDFINMNAFVETSGMHYESDDAKILKGMNDRDVGLDFGLNIDLDFGDDVVSAFFQHDVTGKSKGFKTGLKYTAIVELDQWVFVPFASVDFKSEDFVDYYFGVTQSEVAANRKAYKADGAFSYNLGYKLVMPLTDNLELTQTSAFTRLGSDIADSPLVDSANQWVVGASVAYYF